MAQSLLRALKHRSTPTLPSEGFFFTRNKDKDALQLPEHLLQVPSIFITVPDEDGGDRWCAFAGTVAPTPEALISTGVVPPSPSGGTSLDVPLPDFAALEETIAKLRRAGETPTFRRPMHSDQVVLPKRKHDKHDGKDGGSSKKSTRTKPKRPQTAPTSTVSTSTFAQEQARVEAMKAQVNTPSYIPRYIGTGGANVNTIGKVPKGAKKGKKHETVDFTMSNSYDTLTGQISSPYSFSTSKSSENPPEWSERSPTDSGYGSVTSVKLRKRGSLGWLFNKRNKEVAREVQQVPVVEQGVNLQEFLSETQEIDVVPERFGIVPLSPPLDSPRIESMDKPLPPLPVDHSHPSNGTVAEIGVTDIESKPLYPSESETGIMETHTNSTQQKLKRKFSLKNLRAKLKSSSSSSAPPPVPALPSTPPPLPTKDHAQIISARMSFPEPAEFQSEPSSPTVEASPVSQEPPVEGDVLVEDATDNAVSQEEATNEPTSSGEDMRSLSLDEISEDSTASSSLSSTPASTPPDTPDSVKVGPIFGMFQQGGVKTIGLSNLALTSRDEVTITGLEGDLHSGIQRGSVETVRPNARGLIRSQGMNKLDSLHFEQLDFDLAAF